jgi:hypothetical protein
VGRQLARLAFRRWPGTTGLGTPAQRQASHGFGTTAEALGLYLSPQLSAILLSRLPAFPQIRLVRANVHPPRCREELFGKAACSEPDCHGLPAQPDPLCDCLWAEPFSSQRPNLLVSGKPELLCS